MIIPQNYPLWVNAEPKPLLVIGWYVSDIDPESEPRPITVRSVDYRLTEPRPALPPNRAVNPIPRPTAPRPSTDGTPRPITPRRVQLPVDPNHPDFQ
ncbi:hypothetical protein J3R03_000398 [Actinoplanes couchii]|uniref:Uncharacterized protein n=1 Tax=Actinoplanes couchii TaxID=403638 RepID=A0ABQ3WZU8_9ACTN|nr:hypothetical protein [Actinoplanes couchii]GID51817.1 hypothetical protein Aco03nite_002210 [Actinoplanes couchii]